MPSPNSLLRVFQQTDDNTSLYVVSFQEASYQKQSLLLQHGKFKKMKSLSHVTLFEANIRIPQNCGCTKLLWICHLLSVYLTLQAGRLSLFYLSLHWSFISTLAHTIPCTYAQYFSLTENLNSRKPVHLSFQSPTKGLAIISKLFKTEIETLESTYVNSFFLSLSTPIRFAQCQI